MLDIESKVLRYATAQIDDSVTYTDFEFTKEQKQILNELKTCSESEKENLVDKFNASLEVESLKRIQHATLTIEGLKKGQVKPIKPKQVKELKTYIAKIKREYAKNSNNG